MVQEVAARLEKDRTEDMTMDWTAGAVAVEVIVT
jgi:hypothetical protein